MELIIFTMILLIMKILMQSYWRLTLIFLILDMSQRKKLVIVKTLIVLILCLGITRVNGYIEEKDSNKYLVFDSTDEIKKLLKKYSDVFNGITSKIREVDDDWFE